MYYTGITFTGEGINVADGPPGDIFYGLSLPIPWSSSVCLAELKFLTSAAITTTPIYMGPISIESTTYPYYITCENGDCINVPMNVASGDYEIPVITVWPFIQFITLLIATIWLIPEDEIEKLLLHLYYKKGG